MKKLNKLFLAGLIAMLSFFPIKSSLAQNETPVDTTKYDPYKIMKGHRLAHSKFGEIYLRVWTYARYLNQTGLNSTYIDGFGNQKEIDQRQDIQLNKANFLFSGWAFSPKFTWLVFIWTANPSQGLGAQVAIAGNLGYTFNKHIRLMFGVNPMPGTRSTEGQFPFWLTVDNRTITDEFMRGSYTFGIFASGNIVKKLDYEVMLGNNMSTLGVDAGQLDPKLNTIAGGLIFTPTTGEFDYLNGAYGDYYNHQKVATRVAVHYLHSVETRQGQPKNTDFENTMLRFSDGNSIFAPNLFEGTQIDEARDQMCNFDVGAKFKGFSLDGGYYWRWIDHIKTIGDSLKGKQFFDHGFDVQASAMVWPKRVQLYATYSQIFGQYGIPYEFKGGVNIYPFKTNTIRVNAQYTYLYKCPVGGLSYPWVVGGTGSVFTLDLEMNL